MERISFQSAPQGMYNGMFQMGEFLKQSNFDEKLQELIKYRASLINGCAYCIDMHYKEAIAKGETVLRLTSLSAWRETDYYTEQEQAVLAYTEALTKVADNHIGDDVFEPLKAHFSQDEIAQLTTAIVLINGWNRYMKAFKVTPGQYQVGMFD